MTGFRCKQFYVAHDRCGMKVGTDSLILGSWVASDGITSVIDIGTGSGILSLMLAQRLANAGTDYFIDAVEIEPEAAQQAAENFQASPWSAHITSHCTDIGLWPSSQGYDLMVSNPPYFHPGQQLTCLKRQQARLEERLSLAELMVQAQRLSHPNSLLALIIPCGRQAELVRVGEQHGWFLQRELTISTCKGKAASRVALSFVRLKPEQVMVEDLLIRDEQHRYTEAFQQLTQAFYLAF